MKRDTSFTPALPGALAALDNDQARALSRGFGKAQDQTTSDEALISRIARGERPAMQTLYARHHVRVFRFVVRVLGDRALAEDVVSDVFFDVWRNADQFERRSAVSTWVLRIARLKAFSALKRIPEEEEEWDEEIPGTLQDPGEDPAGSFERKQTNAILRECLSALPPAHREIIDLVYFHNKSIAEAAEIVGIPPQHGQDPHVWRAQAAGTHAASCGDQTSLTRFRHSATGVTRLIANHLSSVPEHGTSARLLPTLRVE